MPRFGSDLDPVDQLAAGQQAGRQKRPAEAAAAVDGQRVFGFQEPRMSGVVAANDPLKPAVRLRDPAEGATAPPEAVELRLQGPGG